MILDKLIKSDYTCYIMEGDEGVREADIIIRKMEDQELDTCADVIRRGFLTVAEAFNLTEEKVPTNGAYIKTDRLIADKQKGNSMHVLESDGTVVGFMQLEKANDATYYLEKITVLPEFRHRGFGSALLDYAVAQVKAMGGEKIGIAIIEENEQLKNWYLEYGFKPTGTRKFEHLPFTVGFMELAL